MFPPNLLWDPSGTWCGAEGSLSFAPFKPLELSVSELIRLELSPLCGAGLSAHLFRTNAQYTLARLDVSSLASG